MKLLARKMLLAFAVSATLAALAQPRAAATGYLMVPAMGGSPTSSGQQYSTEDYVSVFTSDSAGMVWDIPVPHNTSAAMSGAAYIDFGPGPTWCWGAGIQLSDDGTLLATTPNVHPSASHATSTYVTFSNLFHPADYSYVIFEAGMAPSLKFIGAELGE